MKELAPGPTREGMSEAHAARARPQGHFQRRGVGPSGRTAASGYIPSGLPAFPAARAATGRRDRYQERGLSILTRLARDGRVAAAIALERACAIRTKRVTSPTSSMSSRPGGLAVVADPGLEMSGRGLVVHLMDGNHPASRDPVLHAFEVIDLDEVRRPALRESFRKARATVVASPNAPVGEHDDRVARHEATLSVGHSRA